MQNFAPWQQHDLHIQLQTLKRALNAHPPLCSALCRTVVLEPACTALTSKNLAISSCCIARASVDLSALSSINLRSRISMIFRMLVLMIMELDARGIVACGGPLQSQTFRNFPGPRGHERASTFASKLSPSILSIVNSAHRDHDCVYFKPMCVPAYIILPYTPSCGPAFCDSPIYTSP